MLSAYGTDAGNVKDVNQDACLIMEALLDNESFVFAAVCDGMGGLKSGELASASMAGNLRDWFRKVAESLSGSGMTRKEMAGSLNKVILSTDRQLQRYSERNGDCGTTLTGIALYGGRYLCVNIGDSRVYRISPKGISQLTRDQTLTQKMLDDGEITEQEAMAHPGQSILLQCVGAGGEVVPKYTWGLYGEDDLFLLCSDGFRHKFSEKEMWKAFSKKMSGKQMEEAVRKAIETVKCRGERDNLTAVVIAAKE